MSGIGTEVNKVISRINPDAAKAARIARNRSAYVEAVRRTWRDTEAALCILKHSNAFYVRKEETPANEKLNRTARVLCEVYVDDPMIRSEINARQELLRLALAHEGIRFDEFRIIPSKWGMKERHPFDPAIEKLAKGEPSAAASRLPHEQAKRIAEHETREEASRLQNLKRAFCLVFGEQAEHVLSGICSARTTLAHSRSIRERQKRRSWNIHLYVKDAHVASIIEAEKEPLRSRAADLGLSINDIAIAQAESNMLASQAFPRY